MQPLRFQRSHTDGQVATSDVTSGGAITQSGVITIPGTTTLAAGAISDITLNNTGNDFTGTLTINSGRNVTMYTSDTFTVGNVTTTAT